MEIRKACGDDNFFLFGMTKQEVIARKADYNPRALYDSSEEIRRLLDFIGAGIGGDSYTDLYNNLRYSDPYLVLADYADYAATQQRVSETYLDRAKWNHMSVMNIATSGIFAADRAVSDYARDIWHARPIK